MQPWIKQTASLSSPAGQISRQVRAANVYRYQDRGIAATTELFGPYPTDRRIGYRFNGLKDRVLTYFYLQIAHQEDYEDILDQFEACSENWEEGWDVSGEFGEEDEYLYRGLLFRAETDIFVEFFSFFSHFLHIFYEVDNDNDEGVLTISNQCRDMEKGYRDHVLQGWEMQDMSKEDINVAEVQPRVQPHLEPHLEPPVLEPPVQDAQDPEDVPTVEQLFPVLFPLEPLEPEEEEEVIVLDNESQFTTTTVTSLGSVTLGSEDTDDEDDWCPYAYIEGQEEVIDLTGDEDEEVVQPTPKRRRTATNLFTPLLHGRFHSYGVAEAREDQVENFIQDPVNTLVYFPGVRTSTGKTRRSAIILE